LFSFRYHAMSLGAVFLALGIGVLLGVSIGEGGVVSGATKDLVHSLRGDLNSTRSHNADLRRQLTTRDEFESQAFPALVKELLPGWRVGLVGMGHLSKDYAKAVTDAVQPAGAQVDSVSVVKAPLPLGQLADDMKGTRLRRLDRSNDQLERFGSRVGRQLATGGNLLTRVSDDLFSTSRGAYRGLDAIVYVRDRDGLQGAEKDAQDRFETGLLAGMKTTNAQAVGSEMTDTDPSQIGFLSDRGLATVDDIDLSAGKVALVWILSSKESGSYGVKGSAERLLPKPPNGGTGRGG
jgi:hypothetical protein